MLIQQSSAVKKKFRTSRVSKKIIIDLSSYLKDGAEVQITETVWWILIYYS